MEATAPGAAPEVVRAATAEQDTEVHFRPGYEGKPVNHEEGVDVPAREPDVGRRGRDLS